MTQKEIAVQCLEKLDIYKPYIAKFKTSGIPCFFENFAGFYADQEQGLWKKIKEVEETYNCVIYAITHNFFEFGECWAMLCVTEECKDISDCLDRYDNNSFYAFSYVWNATEEFCSEFGDIVVKSFGGGIKRIY